MATYTYTVNYTNKATSKVEKTLTYTSNSTTEVWRDVSTDHLNALIAINGSVLNVTGGKYSYNSTNEKLSVSTGVSNNTTTVYFLKKQAQPTDNTFMYASGTYDATKAVYDLSEYSINYSNALFKPTRSLSSSAFNIVAVYQVPKASKYYEEILNLQKTNPAKLNILFYQYNLHVEQEGATSSFYTKIRYYYSVGFNLPNIVLSDFKMEEDDGIFVIAAHSFADISSSANWQYGSIDGQSGYKTSDSTQIPSKYAFLTRDSSLTKNYGGSLDGKVDYDVFNNYLYEPTSTWYRRNGLPNRIGTIFPAPSMYDPMTDQVQIIKYPHGTMNESNRNNLFIRSDDEQISLYNVNASNIVYDYSQKVDEKLMSIVSDTIKSAVPGDTGISYVQKMNPWIMFISVSALDTPNSRFYISKREEYGSLLTDSKFTVNDGIADITPLTNLLDDVPADGSDDKFVTAMRGFMTDQTLTESGVVSTDYKTPFVFKNILADAVNRGLSKDGNNTILSYFRASYSSAMASALSSGTTTHPIHIFSSLDVIPSFTEIYNRANFSMARIPLERILLGDNSSVFFAKKLSWTNSLGHTIHVNENYAKHIDEMGVNIVPQYKTSFTNGSRTIPFKREDVFLPVKFTGLKSGGGMIYSEDNPEGVEDPLSWTITGTRQTDTKVKLDGLAPAISVGGSSPSRGDLEMAQSNSTLYDSLDNFNNLKDGVTIGQEAENGIESIFYDLKHFQSGIGLDGTQDGLGTTIQNTQVDLSGSVNSGYANAYLISPIGRYRSNFYDRYNDYDESKTNNSYDSAKYSVGTSTDIPMYYNGKLVDFKHLDSLSAMNISNDEISILQYKKGNYHGQIPLSPKSFNNLHNNFDLMQLAPAIYADMTGSSSNIQNTKYVGFPWDDNREERTTSDLVQKNPFSNTISDYNGSVYYNYEDGYLADPDATSGLYLPVNKYIMVQLPDNAQFNQIMADSKWSASLDLHMYYTITNSDGTVDEEKEFVFDPDVKDGNYLNSSAYQANNKTLVVSLPSNLTTNRNILWRVESQFTFTRQKVAPIPEGYSFKGALSSYTYSIVVPDPIYDTSFYDAIPTANIVHVDAVSGSYAKDLADVYLTFNSTKDNFLAEKYSISVKIENTTIPDHYINQTGITKTSKTNTVVLSDLDKLPDGWSYSVYKNSGDIERVVFTYREKNIGSTKITAVTSRPKSEGFSDNDQLTNDPGVSISFDTYSYATDPNDNLNPGDLDDGKRPMDITYHDSYPQNNEKNNIDTTNLIVPKNVSGVGNGGSNQNFGNNLWPLIDGTAADLYTKDGNANYRIEFDWKAEGSNFTGTFGVQLNNYPWNTVFFDNSIKVSDKSGHYNSMGVSNSNWKASEATAFMLRVDNVPSTIKITVSNVKFTRYGLEQPGRTQYYDSWIYPKQFPSKIDDTMGTGSDRSSKFNDAIFRLSSKDPAANAIKSKERITLIGIDGKKYAMSDIQDTGMIYPIWKNGTIHTEQIAKANAPHDSTIGLYNFDTGMDGWSVGAKGWGKNKTSPYVIDINANQDNNFDGHVSSTGNPRDIKISAIDQTTLPPMPKVVAESDTPVNLKPSKLLGYGSDHTRDALTKLSDVNFSHNSPEIVHAKEDISFHVTNSNDSLYDMFIYVNGIEYSENSKITERGIHTVFVLFKNKSNYTVSYAIMGFEIGSTKTYHIPVSIDYTPKMAYTTSYDVGISYGSYFSGSNTDESGFPATVNDPEAEYDVDKYLYKIEGSQWDTKGEWLDYPITNVKVRDSFPVKVFPFKDITEKATVHAKKIYKDGVVFEDQLDIYFGKNGENEVTNKPVHPNLSINHIGSPSNNGDRSAYIPMVEKHPGYKYTEYINGQKWTPYMPITNYDRSQRYFTYKVVSEDLMNGSSTELSKTFMIDTIPPKPVVINNFGDKRNVIYEANGDTVLTFGKEADTVYSAYVDGVKIPDISKPIKEWRVIDPSSTGIHEKYLSRVYKLVIQGTKNSNNMRSTSTYYLNINMNDNHVINTTRNDRAVLIPYSQENAVFKFSRELVVDDRTGDLYVTGDDKDSNGNFVLHPITEPIREMLRTADSRINVSEEGLRYQREQIRFFKESLVYLKENNDNLLAQYNSLLATVNSLQSDMIKNFNTIMDSQRNIMKVYDQIYIQEKYTINTVITSVDFRKTLTDIASLRSKYIDTYQKKILSIDSTIQLLRYNMENILGVASTKVEQTDFQNWQNNIHKYTKLY